MLKQWKAQHGGEVAAAGAGLPADLLEAVRVYERVQEGAKAQVEQLRAEHQQAAQEAARVLEALYAEGRKLGAEREALADELANVKAMLAREQVARQKDAVAIVALESEKDERAQRLPIARRRSDRWRTSWLRPGGSSSTSRMRARPSARTRARMRRAIARTEQEAGTLRTYLQDSREALAVLRSEKVHLEHTLAGQLDAAREQAEAVRRDGGSECRAKWQVAGSSRWKWPRSAWTTPSKQMRGWRRA
jgi:hypothetical protein